MGSFCHITAAMINNICTAGRGKDGNYQINCEGHECHTGTTKSGLGQSLLA